MEIEETIFADVFSYFNVGVMNFMLDNPYDWVSKEDIIKGTSLDVIGINKALETLTGYHIIKEEAGYYRLNPGNSVGNAIMDLDELMVSELE